MTKNRNAHENKIHSLILTCFSEIQEQNDSLNVLTDQLNNEIETGLRYSDSGDKYPPDQYSLSVHPVIFPLLFPYPGVIQDRISNGLQEIFHDNQWIVMNSLHFTLSSDPTMKMDQIRVIGWHSTNPLDFHKEITAPDQSSRVIKHHDDLILVINGKKTFTLNTTPVTIGRHSANDLVLPDIRVSRKHAVITRAGRRFHIEDLKSTSGTFVNGKRIIKNILKADDEIQIGLELLQLSEKPPLPPTERSLTEQAKPGESDAEENSASSLSDAATQITRPVK